MKLSYNDLWVARRVWRSIIPNNFYDRPIARDHLFRSFAGITNKQWKKGLQHRNLKVRPETYKLLVAMGQLNVNSPHIKTLAEVMAVQYNRKLPWKKNNEVLNAANQLAP